MHDSNFSGQVLERYYAQVAEGVQHFPRPSAPATVAPTPGAPVGSPPINQELEETLQASDIAACQKCALSAGRKRVVCAPVLEPRKIFALAEFPESADEDSALPEGTPLFSNEGTSSILLSRLFAKLGLQNDIHRSFALKCVSRKAFPPRGALQACSVNLRAELHAVNPEAIWCFGSRALRALEFATGARIENPEECTELPALQYQGANLRVFYFPSVHELAAFPEWRAAVWESLTSAFPRTR